MKICVIAIQGDIEEHVMMTRKAMEKMGIEGEVIATIRKEDIDKCDAVILPGGESTTISKLLHKNSLAEGIKKIVMDGGAVMGTCAGSILLAKHGDEQIKRTKTKLLGLMDIWIKRNAYGRQRESFQMKLDIKHVGEFEGVFIRAPAIVKAGEKVEILSKLDEYIVAARQNNLLALTFHPELTNDTRLHEYFLKMAL